ncbi:hypothetical protein ES332_D01G260600v1 [Gossypium tomentosum]|uniref:Uncharacterized protein n=1 Tax=Gossypium tomentosum TaxID=34277 RepID=A0A5D2MDN4_GOSTO|nr:hypothetical protein ES332_D01G260600v1 [Gossypium tomentosum]
MLVGIVVAIIVDSNNLNGYFSSGSYCVVSRVIDPNLICLLRWYSSSFHNTKKVEKPGHASSLFSIGNLPPKGPIFIFLLITVLCCCSSASVSSPISSLQVSFPRLQWLYNCLQWLYN